MAVALVAVAGCQQPVPIDPVASEGVGYVVLNGPIVPASRDLLIRDIDQLRNTGASEIRIGLNSPGGRLDAAQSIVDYMARAHSENNVRFKIYNVGVVASAATYIFLSAQDRYTAPRGAFLFHAYTAQSSGPVSLNAEGLREEANKLEAYERAVTTLLKTRTRLTGDAARLYMSRTVVLNSNDAQRDGVVDGIETFTVPKGVRAWVIVVKPNGPAVANAASSDNVP